MQSEDWWKAWVTRRVEEDVIVWQAWGAGHQRRTKQDAKVRLSGLMRFAMRLSEE